MHDEQSCAAGTFTQLGLNDKLADTLRRMGFDGPTDLQKAMIGPILAGHDVVVQARRGQGKTLGYLLPILQQIDPGGGTQVVIVSPTRELAMQVAGECRKLLGADGLKSLALHPGADADEQAAALEKSVQVLAGTPGRLLDILERETLNLKSIKFVVVDELDRLLNSGHLEPLGRLMRELAHGRQLIWVTASVDEQIELLAGKYLVEPQKIEYIEPQRRLNRPVHELVLASQRTQVAVLHDRIKDVLPAASIVVTSRRDDARKLGETLRRAGLSVMGMDEEASRVAGRGRQSRSRTPLKPERQESVVWVGAEMVTRAIDLPHVGLLAHFGPPPGVDTYVDCVCRLVRLGSDLKRVVTLVEPPQQKRMQEMYEAAGVPVEVSQLEAVEEPEPAEPPARPQRGGRREPEPRQEARQADRSPEARPAPRPPEARPAEPKPAPRYVPPKPGETIVPRRYTVPVFATPGKGGLPPYPPRKTLGSKFRTSRSGPKKPEP